MREKLESAEPLMLALFIKRQFQLNVPSVVKFTEKFLVTAVPERLLKLTLTAELVEFQRVNVTFVTLFAEVALQIKV